METKTYNNIIMNVLLGIAVSGYVLYLTGGLSLPNLVVSFFVSFFVGYTIGDLVPVGPLSHGFAGKLGLNPEALPGYVASTMVTTLIMATGISFFSTMINAGIGPHLFGAWLGIYTQILLPVFVLLLIVIRPIGLISRALSGE